MHDLIPGSAELQRKLNSQPCRMSTAKVKALIGKEWDPLCGDGALWEDPDEVGGIELLNSDESSLPVEEVSPPTVMSAFPSPPEGINPVLSEEMVMTSLRQWLCKIMLILLRTHPYHLSWHKDL